jgi:hypothetical protein
MPCFIGGQMKALNYKQLTQYSLAQNTFFRVEAYNTEVRNKRAAGDKTASYYTFKEGEQMLYKQGQYLLTQNDPTNANLYQSVVKV